MDGGLRKLMLEWALKRVERRQREADMAKGALDFSVADLEEVNAGRPSQECTQRFWNWHGMHAKKERD